jgi:hypothetical protein
MGEQVAFGHGLMDLFIRQSSQVFGTVCSTSATTRITRKLVVPDVLSRYILYLPLFYIIRKNASVSHTETGVRYYKSTIVLF